MTVSRRRKAAVVGAVAVALGGLSLGARAVAAGPGASHATRTSGATVAKGHKGHTAPDVTTTIGHGRVNGERWSVIVEFYAKIPKDFPAGEYPHHPKNLPYVKPTSLICERTFLNGVDIEARWDYWNGCHPSYASEGNLLHAGGVVYLTKPLSDATPHFFVSNPLSDVAYGVVTLSDGTRLTARTVEVPRTSTRGWAVAIPKGRTIASVDEYDARHHRVGHDTGWR